MKTAILISILALTASAYAGVKSDKSEPPQRLAAFEMTRGPRSNQDVATRATAAIEALTGRKMPAAAKLPEQASQARGRVAVSAPDAPELEVAYLPEYDELRIVDTELSTGVIPGRDMGLDEAKAIARRTFDELGKRNVVNPAEYNWDGADVASTWIGAGTLDGKVTDPRRRVEYRITARRQINGIEVANAGIRIAVHPSGRVSAVRVGGPKIESKRDAGREEPTGNGRWREKKVSIPELDARFEREVAPKKGQAKVAWARVMYVMPEDQGRAVVEPLYIVSYSVHVPAADGQVAISRRKTVGFSLTDPSAPPVDLTPPARVHESGPEKKLPTAQ